MNEEQGVVWGVPSVQSLPEKARTELIEALAALEHEQWMEWSKELAVHSIWAKLILFRRKKLWVPYEELAEDVKQQNRFWVAVVLSRINTLGFKIVEQ